MTPSAASTTPAIADPESHPQRSSAVAATLPAGWISHRVRHLERWVAWSIALYTAWLAVFALPGVPALWAFVLYAGVIGKWAEARPVRQQSTMAWRGVALIVGAYVLHTHTAPEIGGPTGIFFFWLSITCLYYAFMLKPAWAARLVGAALAAFSLSFAQSPAAFDAADFMAHAGFLLVFPLLLAMRFGLVMREPDDTVESGRMDSSTALYNKAGFIAHGDQLLDGCRRRNRRLTVAVFDCADLLEVRSIYGSRITRELLARIADKMARLAAGEGLAARTGPAEFTVVLPGMGREKALAAIARIMGSPMRVELDTGDNEIVVVPNFMAETAGADTIHVDELYLDLRSDLARRENNEQRRQSYLQRERERHSRPMCDSPAAQLLTS